MNEKLLTKAFAAYEAGHINGADLVVGLHAAGVPNEIVEFIDKMHLWLTEKAPGKRIGSADLYSEHEVTQIRLAKSTWAQSVAEAAFRSYFSDPPENMARDFAGLIAKAYVDGKRRQVEPTLIFERHGSAWSVERWGGEQFKYRCVGPLRNSYDEAMEDGKRFESENVSNI